MNSIALHPQDNHLIRPYHDLRDELELEIRLLGGKYTAYRRPKLRTDDLTGICLYDRKLKTIPQSLVNYPHLRQILLANNQIRDIPQRFSSGMGHLEILRIPNNLITQVDGNITDFKGLRVLDLAVNSITRVSPRIADLSLEEINLGHNSIQRIERLNPELDIVNLSRNRLVELPEMGSEISRLIIDGNPIKNLPRDFDTSNPGIKYLNIDGEIGNFNLIEGLFDLEQLIVYGEMPEIYPRWLGSLHLVDIEVVPECIKHIDIEFLSIRSDRLTKLPDIGEMEIHNLSIISKKSFVDHPAVERLIHRGIEVEVNGSRFNIYDSD